MNAKQRRKLKRSNQPSFIIVSGIRCGVNTAVQLHKLPKMDGTTILPDVKPTDK